MTGARTSADGRTDLPRSMPRVGRCVRYALALAIAVLVGCEDRSEGDEPLEIERLAFVPAGRCRIAGLVNCSTRHALLVDRFEVSRGDWRAVMGEPLPALAGALVLERPEDLERHPMTDVDLEQARRFALARGMRLPTVAEWMRVATGTAAQPWPWGTLEQESAANTAELGLFRSAAVGTFENGQTHLGVHDLLGNVWEWVEPPLPRYDDVPQQSVRAVPDQGVTIDSWPSYRGVIPSSATVDDVLAHPVWAMGGSYLSSSRRLFGWDARNRLYFLAQGLEPAHRADDLGLRCVADAEEYLWAHAPTWRAPDLRQRLIDVGRSVSWSRRSAPLLEGLVARPGAPDALRWLLEGARQ